LENATALADCSKSATSDHAILIQKSYQQAFLDLSNSIILRTQKLTSQHLNAFFDPITEFILDATKALRSTLDSVNKAQKV